MVYRSSVDARAAGTSSIQTTARYVPSKEESPHKCHHWFVVSPGEGTVEDGNESPSNSVFINTHESFEFPLIITLHQSEKNSQNLARER